MGLLISLPRRALLTYSRTRISPPVVTNRILIIFEQRILIISILHVIHVNVSGKPNTNPNRQRFHWTDAARLRPHDTAAHDAIHGSNSAAGQLGCNCDWRAAAELDVALARRQPNRDDRRPSALALPARCGKSRAWNAPLAGGHRRAAS